MTTTGRESRRIFISAGEVSGDMAAARLIEALRAAEPSVIIDGLGGPLMAEAGATVIAPANHIGAVGVSEGLAMAPSALGVFRAAIRHCRVHRPDVAVLIANDIFNVALGRRLRARGVTTIAFFPPQTWIWESVAQFIAPSFDLVLASFPEELQCYRRAGVATEFVGHYLADVLSAATSEDQMTARSALGLTLSDPVVAVLPGSRAREITQLLPVQLAAADAIRGAEPAVQLIVALTSREGVSETGTLQTPAGHAIRVTTDSHLAMRAADVVLCCSGTATLEAALIGVPTVAAYKSSWLTSGIVRASIRAGLMRGETVALPNLLLGRRVVPEFTQGSVTAAALSAAVLSLLASDEKRRATRAAVGAVRAHVARPGTLASVARTVLERAGA